MEAIPARMRFPAGPASIEFLKAASNAGISSSFTLWPVGTVTDSAANPYNRFPVRMRLFPGEEIAAAAQFSRLHGRLLNRRTFTDQDGAYEFKGLPSGRVVVIALVPGKTPVNEEKTWSEQGFPGDAYMVDFVVD